MESEKKKKTLSVKQILYNAVETCDFAQIKKIICSGNIDINQKIDKFGTFTILYHACMYDRDNIVKFLLTRPLIDVNLDNPLAMVALCGTYTILLRLLEHKNIDVNARHILMGFAPIYLAAKSSRINFVKLLIKHGARVDDELNSSIFNNYSINKETRDVLNNWKHYLPEWSPKTHKFFPKEFQELAMLCCCVFNRLNRTINAEISRDIRGMLIERIAEIWKEE